MEPKLYLCIDNCFASKRWTKPLEWMELIKSMGIANVEASADTECDPMYMGGEYLERWKKEVRRATLETGVRAAKLFSGHGTYATLGLTHTDDGARIRFRDEWIKAHMRTAADLGAGMGFFAHGVDESVLQNPEEYRRTMEKLTSDLADLASYAKHIGLSDTGLENMYSPHQPPWTVKGTLGLLKDVYSSAGAMLYITLDVGHMNGQQYFLRPDRQKFAKWITETRQKGHAERVWVGCKRAYELFMAASAGKIGEDEAFSAITALMPEFGYLFADEEDLSVYGWLERLGCYSPIIHLQQSDGKSSPHWPFSEEKNRIGIIEGGKVLRALASSYKNDDGLVKTESIYLTLEPFISTNGNVYDAVYDITQSAQYWRKFIPYDGITLTEAISKLK